MNSIRELSICAAVFLSRATCSFASTMTFDPLLLVPEGQEFSAYAENGISLFAADGPPEHFHANAGRASVFGDDGSPQRISLLNNQAFSPVQIDVATIPRPGTFQLVSSSGAVQTISTAGPIVLGPGFQNVLHVDLIVSSAGAIDIDNIQLLAEPLGAWPVSLALAAFGLLRRRVRRLSGMGSHRIICDVQSSI